MASPLIRQETTKILEESRISPSTGNCWPLADASQLLLCTSKRNLGARPLALDKWAWKETAEVVGVLGIIAGIVFLGYELRQNNALMAAEARFNRLALVTDAWRFVAEHGDLTELRTRADTGETLSAAEERRVTASLMAVFLLTEWTYRELGEGSAELNQVRETQRYNFANYGSYRRV